jgi:CheY-like chemotaxis protein
MHVLVVDDDPDVQEFLKNAMMALGCEGAEVAGSGEDALGKAVVQEFDLITLDVKMPGVSGLEIISVIRGLMPWAVIAIISGYLEDVTDQSRNHADLVLAKPVHLKKIETLVGLTKDLISKRQAIRKLSDPLQGAWECGCIMAEEAEKEDQLAPEIEPAPETESAPTSEPGSESKPDAKSDPDSASDPASTGEPKPAPEIETVPKEAPAGEPVAASESGPAGEPAAASESALKGEPEPTPESRLITLDEVTSETGPVDVKDKDAVVSGNVNQGTQLTGQGSLAIEGEIAGATESRSVLEMGGDVQVDQSVMGAKITARNVVVSGDITETQVFAEGYLEVHGKKPIAA